ncbi:C39 family peptidase [Helcococcus bovis]|uniref:C39 family peptidase n=1 Tax=Helcococcus bovis TaxID=3153252 RepID=UPI0038B87BE2
MNNDLNKRRRQLNRKKTRKHFIIIKLILIFLLFISVVFAVRTLFLRFSNNENSKNNERVETKLENKTESSKENIKNFNNKNSKKDGETRKLGNINIESINGTVRTNKGKIINPFADITFSEKDLNDRIKNLDESLKRKIELYPESKTTVLQYQDYKNDDSEIKDVSKDLENSKEFDRKVKLNYLNQWDIRWGSDKVDNQYIALSGCGPTTLSMIYSSFTGDSSITPFEMAQRMNKLGLYTRSGGEYGLFTQGSSDLGLSGFEIPLSKESVESQLEKGRVIVALVVNNEIGDFTQSSGHYIVISEKKENGKFLIYDVNSYENTNKEWDFDRIFSQSKLFYSIGKN